MAFDGFVIGSLRKELSDCLVGGRIQKIYQPEKDEIHLLIKNQAENQKQSWRLLLSASASLPLVYLAERSKSNPMTAPNFCMVLRKHIQNGKILRIEQPGMERILIFYIEHTDELGDLRTKKLILELMGKHSNLIFADENDVIIDSIKHISSQVSSVRQVLPGRTYVFPPSQGKIPITSMTREDFLRCLASPLPTPKALCSSFQGVSPLMGRELAFRAGIDGKKAAGELTEKEQGRLLSAIQEAALQVEEENYVPTLVFEGKEPLEFSCFPLASCLGNGRKSAAASSMSKTLETYYAQKEATTRIRQKSSDLRRIVATALERTQKKYELQKKQLKDTDKREKYKIYGEMLHTYGYGLETGAKVLDCINYYNNEPIRVPLDPEKNAMENATQYFNRYNKLKRTYEALTKLTVETGEQLEHLESILTALDLATLEADLGDIKEELIQYGYIKRRGGKKARKGKTEKSRPLHYISSDGYHMYVGKNNFQNEEVTFKIASGCDMWFHAKGMAGSHVIVRTEGKRELPDTTYEEAGRLAAYYSKGRRAPKVEIDYTLRRSLKKPAGAKPGFVIYHTNYSLLIEPDISGIREVG